MHGRQAVFPSAFWYSPGLHALQFGALEPSVYCPAPHFVQIISSLKFFCSNFPARQSMHEVPPSLSGSRPSEHVLQPDLLASFGTCHWYINRNLRDSRRPHDCVFLVDMGDMMFYRCSVGTLLDHTLCTASRWSH